MKKYLSIALLLLTMTFVACGTDETKDTDVNNPVEDQAEVEIPNDPVEPGNTEDPVEPGNTEDPVEPDNTEEPVVNMVDFETWAKQEGNEDICLVIWNEELGNQEVMIPSKKSLKAYEVKEADRFAISYRENILYVNVLHANGEVEVLGWENDEYMEISLPIGEYTDVYIFYENELGESKDTYYAFK